MKLLGIIIACCLTVNSFAQKLEATNDLALVIVSIANAEKKPSVGDKVTFVSKKDNKEYSGITGSIGTFEILLPKETFSVLVKGFEEENTNTILQVPNQEGQLELRYNIMYQLPKVYTLRDVNFDNGKATLRPESYKSLNELVELLKRKTSIFIELGGHTDNIGTDISNQILSENRAKSVRAYLISKGIKADRITAVGFGAQKPINTNDTAEGRQSNRRTEVHITKQ